MQNSQSTSFTREYLLNNLVPSFVNTKIKDLMISIKNAMDKKPKIFFLTTYNLITLDIDEFNLLLQKHFTENDIKNLQSLIKIGMLLKSQDIERLEKSKTLRELIQHCKPKNKEDSQDFLRCFQDKAIPLYLNIISELDNKGLYFNFLKEKHYIANPEIIENYMQQKKETLSINI
jgi:hypothetical protein